MISIIAHMTNEQYMPQTALLAIREVHREYISVNITDMIYLLLKEYNKFGYFVDDNISVES